MSNTPSSKAALRSALRQRRKSLTSTEQCNAARALVRAVLDLPCWTAARRIALYCAMDGEIDTGELEKIARAQGKQLFLPVLNSDGSLNFARWDSGATPTRNRYNIPEPPPGADRCPVSELQIIFLPVVGWDLRGGRLGMGGGYYDRTLAGVSGPVLVGLAHANQQMECVPRESWDICLDYIATDAALYRSER